MCTYLKSFLFIYVFQYLLQFKIWNCNIHLLLRASVAPNDLKSTEFSFQGLMV